MAWRWVIRLSISALHHLQAYWEGAADGPVPTTMDVDHSVQPNRPPPGEEQRAAESGVGTVPLTQYLRMNVPGLNRLSPNVQLWDSQYVSHTIPL